MSWSSESPTKSADCGRAAGALERQPEEALVRLAGARHLARQQRLEVLADAGAVEQVLEMVLIDVRDHADVEAAAVELVERSSARPAAAGSRAPGAATASPGGARPGRSRGLEAELARELEQRVAEHVAVVVERPRQVVEEHLAQRLAVGGGEREVLDLVPCQSMNARRHSRLPRLEVAIVVERAAEIEEDGAGGCLGTRARLAWARVMSRPPDRRPRARRPPAPPPRRRPGGRRGRGRRRSPASPRARWRRAPRARGCRRSRRG